MRCTFIVLLFISACTLTGNVAYGPVFEDTQQTEAYFCPQEDCKAVLVNFISSVKDKVDCALYDATIPEVLAALKEKNARLYVDDENLKKIKYNNIRHDTDRQLSHNKFCIADDEKVLTGSFNPTVKGEDNQNNVIILYSKYLAQNYNDEFEELWSGTNGAGDAVEYPEVILNGKRVQNYFCPEDNCGQHIIDVLKTANKSIYFMAYSFTHDAIGDVLVEKFSKGVDVKGIFESSQNNKFTEYTALNAAGVPVKWDNEPVLLHHKVFIIDERIVITGSMNPTNNGDKNNDENIIIIYDKLVTAKFVDEFRRLYK